MEQSPFVQPTLEGIELEQSPELELGNCTITSAVKFRKLVRGNGDVIKGADVAYRYRGV